MKKFCTFSRILHFFPLFWITCAWGQIVPAASSEYLLEMSLEELFEVEVDVASKTSEPIFEASSSVTVFTRRELRAMGVDSVEALLNFVPGFVASREVVFGQGQMVAARGRTTPQTSYNILFLLDGQRLNNDRSGGALAQYHFISLHNVKRVEIIRGPGSALYGTSAFAGVVNIITVDTENQVYFGAGSPQSRDAWFNASEAGADWRVAVSGRYDRDGGETYPEPLRPGQDTTRDPRVGRDLYLKARYRDWRLVFSHHQRLQEDFYISERVGDGINETEFKNNFLRLEYHWLDSEEHTLTLYGSHAWQEGREQSVTLSSAEVSALPSGFTTDREPLITGGRREEREWNFGMEGRWRLHPRHELFAGLEWRRPENVKDRLLVNYHTENPADLAWGAVPGMVYAGGLIESVPLSGEEERDIYSLYVQDKYRIHDKWTATVGARHDEYSDFGGTTSPRVSLLYLPSSRTGFKLLYGHAFRAPAIRQLTSFVGNPELEPEKIKTLELAWLQKYDKAQTTLTWYHSRNSDMIDTRPRPDGPGRQFQNVEEALDVAGWELEAAAQPIHGLSLRAAYSHAYKTEENPRRFPRDTFSLIANYHTGPWNLNLHGYYHGHVQQPVSDGIRDLEGYWVWNTAARYQVNQRLTLFARVENVLDQDYASSIKSLFFNEGLKNRGRTYRLGLEWGF